MKCCPCHQAILEESGLIICSNEYCISEHHYTCDGFNKAIYKKITAYKTAECTCLKCKSKSRGGQESTQ